MRDFPSGACGYASELLQRYLWEKGVFTLYVSGQYGHGWSAQNHAWLETREGTVIDITGDQFKYKTPRFTDPVYVGPRENGFHNMFDRGEPAFYRKDTDSICDDTRLDDRYRAVIKHLR